MYYCEKMHAFGGGDDGDGIILLRRYYIVIFLAVPSSSLLMHCLVLCVWCFFRFLCCFFCSSSLMVNARRCCWWWCHSSQCTACCVCIMLMLLVGISLERVNPSSSVSYELWWREERRCSIIKHLPELLTKLSKLKVKRISRWMKFSFIEKRNVIFAIWNCVIWNTCL